MKDMQDLRRPDFDNISVRHVHGNIMTQNLLTTALLGMDNPKEKPPDKSLPPKEQVGGTSRYGGAGRG